MALTCWKLALLVGGDSFSAVILM